MTTDARARLAQAAQTLSLDLTDDQLDQLLAYMDWLAKWNKVYNLTSLRDPAEMLSHHLIDSLTAVRPLQLHVQALAAPADAAPLRVLDVGSGGGLPGVVLAICLPQLHVTCVDTVNKKAAFIQQVAVALRLPNLKGLHARVESVDGDFDVVTSRAFASLVDFTTWSVKALKPGAVWMAMKGKRPVEELAALGAGVEVFHVEPLVVPGLDVERCLVWMRVRAVAG
jgi:16S rRNA (guanine527-N7)-methyltransferase